MRLTHIRYAEFEGTNRAWELPEFLPGHVTLLVGKNGSGKSRVLNLISGLAGLFDAKGALTYQDGRYHAEFETEAGPVDYQIEFHDFRVVKECLVVGGRSLLERGSGGRGQIFHHREGKFFEFQAPEDQLVAVSRRDAMQHPFFDQLHTWAENVLIYRFGGSLGREKLAVFVKRADGTPEVPPNLKDSESPIPIFREGERKFGTEFVESILTDMRSIGYSAEVVALRSPAGIRVEPTLPSAPMGLAVKEADLADATDQTTMSSGMFRALSLVVQLNYALRAQSPACLLVDDIGEGLDFERSRALIGLLVERAKQSRTQLIMSTNDRFVMDHVPLDCWAVIDRQGGICRILDARNSKERFEEFRFTGLSNFDFFRGDFLHVGDAPTRH